MNLEQLRQEARTGIVFSTPLVQAIERGDKTETRRLLNSRQAMYRLGDLLYIKETWQVYRYAYPYSWRDCTPEQRAQIDPAEWQKRYRAAYGDSEMDRHMVSITRWNSSRFMPRWVARRFISVHEVEHCALQSITEEQAIKEGFPSLAAFIKAWNALNKDRPFSSNPFVVRYAFTKVEVEL